MISKMHLATGQQVQGLKRTYLGGPDGLVADIDPADIPTLLAAGATYTVMPNTLSLMVAPHQVLSYGDGLQKADEHGIILDVPFNTAIPMIQDPAHPARVATDEELARAGYHRLGAEIEAAGNLVELDADELGELRTAAGHAEAIFKALSARFNGAEIVDTGEVSGIHEDMIFAVRQDGVEVARGTVTDLFARSSPVTEAPVALAAEEIEGPNDDVRIVNETDDLIVTEAPTELVDADDKPVMDDEPDTDEGDLLPETPAKPKKTSK